MALYLLEEASHTQFSHFFSVTLEGDLGMRVDAAYPLRVLCFSIALQYDLLLPWSTITDRNPTIVKRYIKLKKPHFEEPGDVIQQNLPGERERTQSYPQET